MRIMCKSFSKEQVEHLERIENVDARYKCAQRYMRELNEGKKGERVKALEYYKKYSQILEACWMLTAISVFNLSRKTTVST